MSEETKIPPRPWRVNLEPDISCIFADDGESLLYLAPQGDRARDIAELVVRTVNAEPEIVAALEAAERALARHERRPANYDPHAVAEVFCVALAHVRAALVKVKG